MSSLTIASDATTGAHLRWDKPNDYGEPAPFAVYDAAGAQIGRRWRDEAEAVAAFARLRTLRPCEFYFVDDPVYAGWTDGTTWNGFANVWVTPETRDQICADWLAADAASYDDYVAELRAATPDAGGLISLANGWAAELEQEG